MRINWRGVGTAALVAATMAAAPASAQFFLQSRDTSGASVTGAEPGMTVPMPGATPAEQKAGLAWTLRSALNVAALQCQFEPTLMMVDTYNAILRDHDGEFDKDQAVLQGYYARIPGAGAARAGKGSKAGQAGFDQFGTKTYSAFSTVSSQFGFCQNAAAIGQEALYTPRGEFGDLAERRMRQLRNSLVPAGEQRFSYYVAANAPASTLPRFDKACWDKKDNWVAKKCGPMIWPPLTPPGAAAVAAR